PRNPVNTVTGVLSAITPTPFPASVVVAAEHAYVRHRTVRYVARRIRGPAWHRGPSATWSLPDSTTDPVVNREVHPPRTGPGAVENALRAPTTPPSRR